MNLDGIIEKDKHPALSSQGSMRIKQSIAVQDRCFVLIQGTGEVISWGGNEKGQLGHGNYQDTNQPQKIESFAKASVKIEYIAAGGDLNLACS